MFLGKMTYVGRTDALGRTCRFFWNYIQVYLAVFRRWVFPFNMDRSRNWSEAIFTKKIIAGCDYFLTKQFFHVSCYNASTSFSVKKKSQPAIIFWWNWPVTSGHEYEKSKTYKLCELLTSSSSTSLKTLGSELWLWQDGKLAKLRFEVTSLNVTWRPDLTWPGPKFLHKMRKRWVNTK